GYPLFNYYPPLSTYLIESLHLFGFDFVNALKAAFVVMLAIAAGGAYALGAEIFRDEKNSRALGILTAVAYVCFPYLLTDIYTRGVSTEALGLVLLPWVVWALRRVITTPSLSAIILGAIFLALLVLAHILTFGIVAPVIGVYVILELKQSAVGNRTSDSTKPTSVGWLSVCVGRLGALVAAISIAAGLSAFYWLPFIAELSLVRLGRGGVPIGAVFPDHFLKPSDLIQSSWFYQYTPAPFALGLAPVLLGALAFILTLIARKPIRARATIIFFGVVAFVCALAMSEPTRDLWLAVPFALMIQYPWRVSVLINLSVAILINAPALAPRHFDLPRRLNADVLPYILIALIACFLILTAFGNLAPQEIFLPDNAPTLAHVARYEASSKFIGATTWGEYLPAAFRVRDLATYRAPQTSAPHATIRLTQYDAARREMSVTASEPISLSLRAFYFPDWRVTIDDQPAAAYASTPQGLLTVDVPAGDHRVVFVQSDTPPRQIGVALSIAGLIALFGLAALALRRREPDARAVVVAVALVCALFAPIAIAAVTAPPRDLQATRVSVTPALELIGLRVENARLESDVWRVAEPAASLRLRVYWLVKQIAPEKPLTWRLVDDAGKVWASREQLPRYGTGYAASWVANEVVEDAYDLPLAAIASGRYQLQVAPAVAREFVPVSAIELTRGVASSTAPDVAHPINAHIGQKIRLLGFDAPEKLIPGSRFSLTLFWQTDENVYDDYTAFVQWLDAEGNAVLKYDSVPGGGLNSPFLWIPGETIADRVVFNLPNDLKPGKYTVTVGMYHYPELERLPVTKANGELSPDDVIELGIFEIDDRK
ncbi:MAG: 6-pyruvoyl-tetrahydropterin synthase-related protein, partial [Chloroflexota bacterium]